jgi:hypothetical protein
VRRTELTRERQFFIAQIACDDGRCVNHSCTQQPCKTDASQAHDGNRRSRRRLHSVCHRTYARHDCATKHCGFIERQRGIDFDERFAGHHRVLGKSRDAEMVMHIAIVAMNPSRAAQQHASRIRLETRLTQRRPPMHARLTRSATRHESSNDVIADSQIIDLGTHLDNLTSTFVTDRHRHRSRPIAIDDRQIRMTQTRRTHAHQHFTRPRRIKIHLDNLQRPRLRIRARQGDFIQNGSASFHWAPRENQNRVTAKKELKKEMTCRRRGSA